QAFSQLGVRNLESGNALLELGPGPVRGRRPDPRPGLALLLALALLPEFLTRALGLLGLGNIFGKRITGASTERIVTAFHDLHFNASISVAFSPRTSAIARSSASCCKRAKQSGRSSVGLMQPVVSILRLSHRAHSSALASRCEVRSCGLIPCRQAARASRT